MHNQICASESTLAAERYDRPERGQAGVRETDCSRRNGDGGGGDMFREKPAQTLSTWSETLETRELDVNTWIASLGDWGKGSQGMMRGRYLRDKEVETWKPCLYLEMKCIPGEGLRGSWSMEINRCPLSVPRRLLPLMSPRGICSHWKTKSGPRTCAHLQKLTPARNYMAGNGWTSTSPLHDCALENT